eukprot:jgi/Botrbrau1/6601/Bobra.0189s0028.1
MVQWCCLHSFSVRTLGSCTFEGRTFLLRKNLLKLGEYATKFALIVLIFHIALYRCRKECPADLFLDVEEQLYKVRKYLLLTAATGATTSLAMAALLTPFNIPLGPPRPKPCAVVRPSGTSPPPSSDAGATSGGHSVRKRTLSPEEGTKEPSSDTALPREAVRAPTNGTQAEQPKPTEDPREPLPGDGEGEEQLRWSSLLGTLTHGVAEGLGLDVVLDQKPYASAVWSIVLINMVLMPLVVIYVVWPLWIPQLPALRFFIRSLGSLSLS